MRDWKTCRPEWHLLPRMDWERARWATWRERAWWSLLRSDITRPIYEALMWLGFWDVVVEGGWLWADGRWCWDFWRTPWSVWRRKQTARERYGK